jgi:hypothetical protein
MQVSTPGQGFDAEARCHWRCAHPVEVFLVLVAMYALWVILPVEARERKGTRKIPANKIDELRFDYLPDFPLNHGWVIAYPKSLESTEKWTSAK